MLRGLILLILLAGVAVLVLPFVVSSVYVDQRGITIPGRVFSKSETVTVPHSGWQRTCEVTIEYEPPDTAGVSFLKAVLLPERYDGFHKGQPVSLHYLRGEDVPDLPMAHTLREIHFLPMARLADQRTFSGVEARFSRTTVLACEAAFGMALLLVVWRRLGLGGFPWVVGACLLGSVAAVMISEFPTPGPRPASDVRQGSGKVKSLDRIDQLFAGSHTRGVEADQVVDVVGVEFVPAGRTDPVVAVDLIDAGSVPELKVGKAVGIEYEGGSPRTAYIQGATRGFVSRNLTGIVVEGVLCLLVLLVFLAGGQFLGRAWNRLLERRKL